MANVAENSLSTFTVTGTVVDTTGLTVGVYLAPSGGGVATLIGSAAGDAAGTDISIVCDFSLVSPGDFELEVVADVAGSNPITLIPNDGTGWPLPLVVKSISAIT